MMEVIEAFVGTFIATFMVILQFIILVSGFALPFVILYYTQNLWMLLSGIIIIPVSVGLFKAIDSLADIF